MAEQKSNSTFVWRTTNEEFTLPIDYSIQALEKKWGINHNKIREYITAHEQFSDFYQWMQYPHIEAFAGKPFPEYPMAGKVQTEKMPMQAGTFEAKELHGAFCKNWSKYNELCYDTMMPSK